MKHQLIDNTEKNSFEFHISGEVARIEYALTRTEIGGIALLHTEIPDNLRGRGIGTELTESTLNYVREKGLRVIPLCGFVSGYIRRHPEWKAIVMDNTVF